eukprot:jgi/Botrbrau1/8760/Bobra.0090s0032.1
MADLLPCVRACDLWGPNAAACLDFCALRATSKPFGDFPGGGPGFGGLPVSVSIGLAIVLVPLSGLFAGLTLGLLSLDLVGLRILASAGEPEEQEYAKAIIPVRKQGNLLAVHAATGQHRHQLRHLHSAGRHHHRPHRSPGLHGTHPPLRRNLAAEHCNQAWPEDWRAMHLDSEALHVPAGADHVPAGKHCWTGWWGGTLAWCTASRN